LLFFAVTLLYTVTGTAEEPVERGEP